MQVLSIGNSFSQDAQYWLHDIAAADGVDMQVVNLYIGGCSLAQHWENYQQDVPSYDWELNGRPVAMCALKEALTRQRWDVVTLQQASHFSGQYETFQPYLQRLAATVREQCPDAVLYIHQTWSYESDSTHAGFAAYECSQQVMYDRLTDCYIRAAQAITADILPVGRVIQTLRTTVPAFDYEKGGMSLNRDGFHLSLLYGRYAAALTWYGLLTGRDVRCSRFIPRLEGEDTDKSVIDAIRQTVHEVLTTKGV